MDVARLSLNESKYTIYKYYLKYSILVVIGRAQSK